MHLVSGVGVEEEEEEGAGRYSRNTSDFEGDVELEDDSIWEKGKSLSTRWTLLVTFFADVHSTLSYLLFSRPFSSVLHYFSVFDTSVGLKALSCCWNGLPELLHGWLVS